MSTRLLRGRRSCEHDKSDRVERLTEIKDEIKDLLNQALALVPKANMARERAKAYWYANMIMCIDKEHEYVGGCMCTMQDTIDEILNPED